MRLISLMLDLTMSIGLLSILVLSSTPNLMRNNVQLTDTSGVQLYLAPSEVISLWKKLDPMVIDCRVVGGRSQVTIPDFEKAEVILWSGHETEAVAGFLCMGRRKLTECSSPILSPNEIKHSEVFYVPDLSKCSDARLKYIEHHIEESEYPTPICNWGGTHTEQQDTIHIEGYSSEYDKMRNQYKDHFFFQGVCKESPCLIHTRDGYWFNTTNPEGECKFSSVADIKITKGYKEIKYSDIKILSLGLHSTSFDGACIQGICDKKGLKLTTNEWLSFTDGFIPKDLPLCDEKDITLSTLTEDSILQELMREVQYSRDYQKCQLLKEHLLTNEPVTRSEIAILQPTVEGVRPVYMYNGTDLLVATAKYSLTKMHIGAPDSHTIGSLGFDALSGKSIDWLFSRKINKHLVDGPNGMFWYKGELVNPKTWEGGLAAIMEESRAHYITTKDVEGSEMEDSILDKIDNLPIGPTPVSRRNHLMIILGLITVVAGISIYCVKKRCQNSRGNRGPPVFANGLFQI